MSAFFYSNHQQQHQFQSSHHGPSHNHHGRSRRAPRLPAGHNPHRQYRAQKPQKEVVAIEPPSLTAYRQRFEAGRSFDLDDDLEFCPFLLTFDEVCTSPLDTLSPNSSDMYQKQSISSGSDRSSLSSGSPESSPLQQQIQPEQVTPAFSLSSAATSNYISPPTFTSNTLQVHQPSAIRSCTKAIPIVNPSTGSRIASPPNSVSPGMMQMGGRW
jgi:Domain of unknown function (DUF4452)